MPLIRIPSFQNHANRVNPAFSRGGVPQQPPAPTVPDPTFRRLSTSDGLNYDTVIASLPNIADMAQLNVTASGRSRNAATGRQFVFLGSAIRRPAPDGLSLLTNLSNVQAFGSPGAGISILTSGDNVIVRVNGLAGVTFDWTISWGRMPVVNGSPA